ncbi:DUF2004 domain-containing protein [Chitinophagaceae bacterium LWZ2-11]
MTNITLPYFGELNSDSLDEYYDEEIEFNGRQIDLDLNFENETIEPAKLESVKRFIENIALYNAKNEERIMVDYNDEDCDTAKTYAEHHLEELSKDDLSQLVDFDDKSIDPERQLLKKLQLVRVGLYPDNDEDFAIFDYSIGQDLTNYLVVVFTNVNGEMDYMTMES